MSIKITFDTSILDRLAGIQKQEVINLIASALRQHSHIVTDRWSSLITNTPGPHLTLAGTARRPYRKALRLKIWKWSERTGVTAIFGPSGREVPHAHLAELGTAQRSRLPYFRTDSPRGGHGVRGRYESVNFRGSRKHGRPPFPANHPILRTGAVAPRRWLDQAENAVGERFAHAVLLTFRELFNDFLASKLVGPSQ
jgi:hypothetical protein